MLFDEPKSFKGQYFQLNDARCNPKPLQKRLPIWVGGQGEKRTLRTAAKYADGWNAPSGRRPGRPRTLSSTTGAPRRAAIRTLHDINVGCYLGADWKDVSALRGEKPERNGFSRHTEGHARDVPGLRRWASPAREPRVHEGPCGQLDALQGFVETVLGLRHQAPRRSPAAAPILVRGTPEYADGRDFDHGVGLGEGRCAQGIGYFL